MQPVMRTKMPGLARTMLPVAVGAGCMITFLCVIDGIGATTKTAPRFGDIISFQSTSTPPSSGELRLTVQRADGSPGCTLDLGTLRHTGGSFVIESEASKLADSFQVHWAGDQTTTDTGDCGASANLIVQASDLNMLALAAGGYGVVKKRLPISAGRFRE